MNIYTIIIWFAIILTSENLLSNISFTFGVKDTKIINSRDYVISYI